MDNIRITIETNAEDAAKTFEDLSKAFEDSTQSSEDLRKQIKGLKDDIYKLTPGTEEYSKKLQELGAKMNTLGDIQRDLKASSGGLDDVFSTTTRAVGTMASGFQAAAGIVTLFGKNSSDLQKTFVKLQSVMAIAQGLQGFSGFIKYTETASASVKAFVNKLKISTAAVKADTTEKSANATATKTLAAAENTATASTVGLAGAFNKLKAAFASNPIGIIIIALTTLIGLVTRYNTKQDERIEREQRLNKVLGENAELTKSQVDFYRDEAERIENTASKLEALGASQEDVNKYRENSYEAMKSENEQWLKQNEYLRNRINYANQLAVIEKSNTLTEEERTKYLNEGRHAMDAFNKEYEERLALAEEWNNLEKKRKNDTDPFYYYNKSINEAKKNLQELVELGKISEKQAKEELIVSLRLKIGSLQNYRGRDQDEIALRKQQIKDYQEEIKQLEKEIKKIDDDARKESQKNWQDRVSDSKKSMESLLSELEETNKELTEKVNDEVGKKSLLDAMFGADDDAVDAAAIRIRKSAITLYAEYKKAFDDFIKKAQADDSLLSKDLATVTAKAEEYMGTLQKVFEDNGMDPSFLTEDVRAKVDEVQGLVDAFTKANERYKQLLESGQMTLNEYQAEIIDAYKTFVEERNKALEGQSEDMIRAMAGVDIPDAAKSEIRSEIANLLDEIYDNIENPIEKYTKEKEQNEAMEEFYKKLFGGGEIPYDVMKKNLQDQLKAYENIYNEEVKALDNVYSGFAEGSAEYEEYMKKRAELDAEWAKTHAEIVKKITDLDRQNILNTLNVVSTAISGLSSFGSAMQSYYDDMANNEAKTEEERKKYTIKGLRMQELQAVASVAQGIVSAIATAYQMPAPYGAILAAIQAASVAAAGAVQIAVIEKQIQRAGGSGSSSSTNNPSGLVDRVIMGEAQNADQQAQLNGEYNQGSGATRVFVTTEDINAKQGETKTAVTNNTF